MQRRTNYTDENKQYVIVASYELKVENNKEQTIWTKTVDRCLLSVDIKNKNLKT